ncbi:MAG: Spy/CpxP family protein refolding chaperone [Muribaculaceae bacterium]|nr:Spy/CpxP family protein refolding chaperone [Muribaculaceae bacterium]
MQRIFLLIVTIFLSLGVMAQKEPRPDKGEWMKEMQQYKNEFVAKKLELTEEQKTRFIPLYTKMDKEIRTLVEQTYKMSREVKKKGAAATDLEKEKAAEAQFECKMKEGQIEMKYFKEFKKILTPDQLMKFKDVERKFAKQLLNKHREQRKTDKKDKR